MSVERLQNAFITGFHDIVKTTTTLKKRDWLFILPSDIRSSFFVALYDVKTGIGSGINLNKFLSRSFTRIEAYSVMERILDNVYNNIQSGMQSEQIDINTFSYEYEGYVAVQKKTVQTGGDGKIYTYTLEKKEAA